MNGDPWQFKLALIEALRREVAGAAVLHKALLGEKAAICGYDESRILAQAERKQALVDGLQHLTAARTALMERQGFAADRNGVEACIEACPANTELRLLFAELGGLARECFDENRLVGRLINRHSQFIANALNSLNAPAGWQQTTYGGNGKADAGNAHRRFGRA